MKQHAQQSFWKRKGLKLPGSVAIVPSWTNTSPDNDSQESTTTTTTTTPIIGARYTYTSLVTTQDTFSKPAILPSQYSQPTTITTQTSKKSESKQKQPQPQKKNHTRNTSHNKSFNAFLRDTNDEWNDTILGSNEPKTIESIKEDQTIDHEALNKASKAAEAIIATAQTQKKQSKNPNGVKDHIEELILGNHSLKWIDLEETKDPSRLKKFQEILSVTNVDLVALRSLSWSGIPEQVRMMAWQLLLGYLPCNSARRETTLARKRKEYADSVTAAYARGTAGLDQALWHQIHIDIPRTNPGIPLYQYEATQMCLERILYQWAIRHPASGYVQGINDLVTPIFEVFLSAYIDQDPEQYDVSKLDKEVLSVIEADSFWCLSKLLDGIQDNYTFAQPGIQRQIVTLKELVTRIDARLAQHLQNEGIEFIQFAFRWMNCLLMRELPLRSTIRMWDTYLAEGSSEGFSEFHVYVCAAFLVKWSNQLQKLDFQGVMIFLQQLPTQGWQAKDVELLLSEAYMWKTLFHNAPNHLK
ncbi:rab-GTPase-TBC domain-containing protein [Gilbertella persicaria]|uniref:rab-GTPase-TBC domain-containing protein n=1 Tax=Gilbertella persicaria TaxID=101096 RepID=UPI002220675F|nr:rab-GTPase-TBC domain-containing protein [Gilbertella persicaria]KAI8076519.1 rab-GTPase-TBC domain-containing protein [Gilbertella persicaria]